MEEQQHHERLEVLPGTDVLKPTIELLPWIDPVVEANGFGPRSMYVEMCWLPVLGPTATWLYRRLGSWAETSEEGLELDLIDLSVSLGLGEGLGKNSMLVRAIGRLDRFRAAHLSGDYLAVRRALAPLPESQAKRLSYSGYLFHQAEMAKSSAGLDYSRQPKPELPQRSA